MTRDRAEEDARLALLRTADLVIEGVLTDASNITVRAWLDDDTDPAGRSRAVYKPVRGTAPLRDFDATTLAAREVAAYLVSRAGGWDLVPPTVFRDGPLGPGSVQWWIEGAQDDSTPGGRLLDVMAPADLPSGWRPVVHAEDELGGPLVVAHADRADLAAMAVLDVVLNNADRKGAHVALDARGRLWGFDHGLTMHPSDKLRTVLWGWAGEELTTAALTRLDRLRTRLRSGQDLATELTSLLTALEVRALRTRVDQLLTTGCYPMPPAGRYPLPWPIW